MLKPKNKVFPLKNKALKMQVGKQKTTKPKSIYDAVFDRLLKESKLQNNPVNSNYVRMFNMLMQRSIKSKPKPKDCSKCFEVTKIEDMQNNPSTNYSFFWSKTSSNYFKQSEQTQMATTSISRESKETFHRITSKKWHNNRKDAMTMSDLNSKEVINKLIQIDNRPRRVKVLLSTPSKQWTKTRSLTSFNDKGSD